MDFKQIAQENQILKIRVGSHLFGTNTPDSDEDYFGIFMPPDETIFGFQTCNEVDLGIVDKDDTGRNTKDAVDFKIHDYRKFVKTVMENNPNFIHAIFVNEENILEKDEYGFADRLLSIKDRVVHKGAYRRFVAYAHAQQHKMKIKPENYSKLERGLEVLEGYDKFTIMVELKDVEPFVFEGRGKHIKLADLSFNSGIYVRRARKMIRERLSKATSRAVLYTKFGYDTKFASNLIHLLMSGRELMETGRLVFPLAYAQDILDVKQGKYSAEEIDKWAEQLLEEARVAYDNTKVYASPLAEIEQFAMQELYEWSRMTTKLRVRMVK